MRVLTSRADSIEPAGSEMTEQVYGGTKVDNAKIDV